jgi:hypothetical protein
MSIISDDEVEQTCDHCGKTFDCDCVPEDFVPKSNEANGWEVYQVYNALRLHFNSGTYDYFKFHGKSNCSKTSFLNNKAKYMFYRISRKYSVEDAFDFFIANMTVKDNPWIADLVQEEAHQIYQRWQKKQQSLMYHFKEELDKVLEGQQRPDDILLIKGGQNPPLLDYLISGGSLEFVCMLNEVLHFVPVWNKKVNDDIIYPIWARRIEKYSPFLKFDRNKAKEIVQKKVKEFNRE